MLPTALSPDYKFRIEKLKSLVWHSLHRSLNNAYRNLSLFFTIRILIVASEQICSLRTGYFTASKIDYTRTWAIQKVMRFVKIFVILTISS